MFAGRLFAVRLLLADQRVQFAEMFFFLPFFCLEEEVHFSYDISSDRLTDVFFSFFIVGHDDLCQYISDQKTDLFQLSDRHDFCFGDGCWS